MFYVCDNWQINTYLLTYLLHQTMKAERRERAIENNIYTEVGSTAVQKYRGTVTRYAFSTVTGTVGTFST